MALEDRAKRDTIRWVHLQSDMHDLLTSVISPLLSPSGGLRTNSLVSLILDNEGEPPLDVAFFAHSHLSKLRRLELSGCSILSWDRLASQTTLLTSLVIFLPDDSLAPTMPQLLLILASNPYLRKLKLNPQAIPESDDDGDGSGRVLLHHLEELRLDGDAAGGSLRAVTSLRASQKVDIVLNLSHCVVPDISQTIAPYLRDYLRRRGRSRRGLGLSLSCGGYITFIVGNASRMNPSTSISSRMVPFMSITVGFDQAVPEDVLEKLTLDLIAHTPREEIVYFRTSENLEAVKDLGAQMPNLKALDLLKVPLSAVFPMLDQNGPRADEMSPPSLQQLFLGLLVKSYDWVPLIDFLIHHASSGNQLDSLRIDGPCHMCSVLA